MTLIVLRGCLARSTSIRHDRDFPWPWDVARPMLAGDKPPNGILACQGHVTIPTPPRMTATARYTSIAYRHHVIPEEIPQTTSSQSTWIDSYTAATINQPRRNYILPASCPWKMRQHDARSIIWPSKLRIGNPAAAPGQPNFLRGAGRRPNPQAIPVFRTDAGVELTQKPMGRAGRARTAFIRVQPSTRPVR